MTKVLLIEDQENQRREYTTQLKARGFEVLSLSGIKELESSLATYRPEIVLSDTSLGNNQYGDDVFRTLHANGKIHNEMILGMSSNAAMQLGWAGVAYSFIPKGTIHKDLGEKVNSLFDDFNHSSHKPFTIDPLEKLRILYG